MCEPIVLCENRESSGYWYEVKVLDKINEIQKRNVEIKPREVKKRICDDTFIEREKVFSPVFQSIMRQMTVSRTCDLNVCVVTFQMFASEASWAT